MQHYEETNRIEFKDDYDVIVVGGGMAGVGAALAAAREGMNTLLIEKQAALGGLATLGHVVCYQPLDDGYGNQVIGGISAELLKLSILYGYDNLPRQWKDHLNIVDDKVDDPETWVNFNKNLRCQTFFNAPAFIYALDEVMEQAGADVLFDTIFCKPIMDGNTVVGLIVENKSGRSAYGAKMVVDASGDADVLYRSGADCADFGNHLSYMCYDINFEKMKDAIAHNNMYRAIPDWLMLGYNPRTGIGPSEKYLGTSGDSVNEFIKRSRKFAFDHLKAHRSTGYTHLSVSTVPAFRTTRRINGLYLLTADDYFRHFDDSIGLTGDWRRIGPVVEIPYRSLIDPKITNVISSGRIIASNGDAWELTRCIPPAALTGEAAGRAAAQAIRNKQTVQEIDVAVLQKSIERNGGVIHMEESVAKLHAK